RLISDVVTGKVDVRGIEVPDVDDEEGLALDERAYEASEIIDDELETEVEG
ncbi:MAG TPA: restriction endonuclease subunit S, partial [Gammaproteobacteria bacterium]|nr:restriction endonuclease subunit S [Gammaproteobacteria bacterium]